MDGKINAAGFSLLLLLSTSTAFANTDKVKQADNLIQNWLSIEQQRNAIINDWHQQKPLLEQRLTLLKQEQVQLEQSLTTANTNDSNVEEKRTQLLQSQNKAEIDQAQLESALVHYYQQITALQPQLPPPLLKAWQSKLSQAEFHHGDTTTRLSTLLELLEQLHDFEQRISHVQSALILPTKAGDSEVMVHQLYIGLSQAWYVSLDGSLVGRGQPTAQGWQWLADSNVDSDTVLQAIAMIERRTEAKFLQLPIHLQVAINE